MSETPNTPIMPRAGDVVVYIPNGQLWKVASTDGVKWIATASQPISLLPVNMLHIVARADDAEHIQTLARVIRVGIPEFPGADLTIYLSRLTWATTQLAALSEERFREGYEYSFQAERRAQRDVIKAREKRIDVIRAMVNMVFLPEGEMIPEISRELEALLGEYNPTPAHLEPDAPAANE